MNYALKKIFQDYSLNLNNNGLIITMSINDNNGKFNTELLWYELFCTGTNHYNLKYKFSFFYFLIWVASGP